MRKIASESSFSRSSVGLASGIENAHFTGFIFKQAPFNKRGPQLVPTAGRCVDCPKRTGHRKLLFVVVSGNTDACKLCGIWASASHSCWLLSPRGPEWQIPVRIRAAFVLEAAATKERLGMFAPIEDQSCFLKCTDLTITVTSCST